MTDHPVDRNRVRRARGLWLLLPMAIALGLLSLLRGPVRAATISVADGEVEVNDNGVCSLIEAISNANDTVDGQPYDDCAAGDPAGIDTVQLYEDSVYVLSGEWMTAAFTIDGATQVISLGLPLISSQVGINGMGATINRAENAGTFSTLGVQESASLTVAAVNFGGGVGDYGAAIISNGTLVVGQSSFGGFSATSGAAIYCELGSVGLFATQFAFNEATADGGGLLGRDCEIFDNGSAWIWNRAERGGAVAAYGGSMLVYRSSFIINVANGFLGAHILSGPEAEVTVVNTTATNGLGSAMSAITGTLTIQNSTLARDTTNTSSYPYQGLYAARTFNLPSLAGGNPASVDQPTPLPPPAAPLITVTNSIVTGIGEYSSDVFALTPGLIASGGHNVFGNDAYFTADSLVNFTPAATDVVATADGENIAYGDIVSPDAVFFGGPAGNDFYHTLPSGSPALDLAPSAGCAVDTPVDFTDQIGNPRNVDYPGADNGPDNLCDAGAIEQPSVPATFVSAVTAGTTGNGVAYFPEDILTWDGAEWQMFFDGSDYGLTHNRLFRHNVNAIFVPDPASPVGTIMSFWHNRRTVPGIDGKVDGMDLVEFNGFDFQIWFDGQDVGLTALTNEKIDALHILDGDQAPQALKDAAGGSCEAYLLISTHGAGFVPNYDATSLRFSGEDVLGFCMTQSGPTTQGKWMKMVDGSDAGFRRNSLANLSADETGQTLYLTTRRGFDWGSLNVVPEQVYSYDVGAQELNGPIFSAPDYGFPSALDSLQWGETPSGCTAASDC